MFGKIFMKIWSVVFT